jgi:hypothetical protein
VIVDVALALKSVFEGAPSEAVGPFLLKVYVRVTAVPVPAFPLASCTADGVTVTVTVSPSAHVPPDSVAVASVPPALIATSDTVGSVAHVPPIVKSLGERAVVASVKVAMTADGICASVASSGVSDERVGPVLSTVMTALSFDTTDAFFRASIAIPASAWSVNEPLPVHPET